MKKSKLLIVLLTLFAFGQTAWAQLSGEGTNSNPYRIANASDWNYFSTHNGYANSHIRLEANLSGITQMVNYSFEGTFDGYGHTITFNINNNGNQCAPFQWLSNAAILNLHTAGSIKTTGENPAGFAARVTHDVHFVNCRSSMSITCNHNGDAGWGGFIGACTYDKSRQQNLNIYFENCLFDGAFQGSSNTTCWGGFIGYYYYESVPAWYKSGEIFFNNCLFAPTSINIKNSTEAWDFVRYAAWVMSEKEGTWQSFPNHGNNFIRMNNLYYTKRFGNNPPYLYPTEVGSMTNEQLCAALGEGWEIINNKVVPLSIHYPSNGDGSESSPYLINNEQDWIDLANAINAFNEPFKGKHFQLNADISVSRMLGSSENNCFQGIFDGQGHTLNVTISGGNGAAPFRYIGNATIKNLHVTGTVTGTDYHASGLVGHVVSKINDIQTINLIENCRVSTNVNVATLGAGIVGHAEGSNTRFVGCVYDGIITNTANNVTDNNRSVGGLVGWCDQGRISYSLNYILFDAVLTFTDCLFAGTYDAGNSNVEFHPIAIKNYNVSPECTVNNTYYMVDPDEDGDDRNNIATTAANKAYSIVGDDYANAAFTGSAVNYSVSGINAYATGMIYNNVMYAGGGEDVFLELDEPLGFNNNVFCVNAGTIKGNGNPFTLTMPEENVVITAEIKTFHYDINKDNMVSITDVTFLVNRILGIPNQGEDMHNFIYDVNADGMANVTDVTCLINKIMGLRNLGEIPSFLACPDDNHPHLIDLGLPSGMLWSCCNVGADTPVAYGCYYAWGETEEAVICNKSNYIHYNESEQTYKDIGSDIAGTQYDVAHKKWRGDWMMPSIDKMNELLENCNYEWTTVNGVYGGKFTSKTNGGSIFLPAAGFQLYTYYFCIGEYSSCWSSMPDLSNIERANGLALQENGFECGGVDRFYGLPVRPVWCSPKLEISSGSLTLVVGSQNTVEVTFGSGNYSVSSSSDAVATVMVDNSIITVTGVREGQATITVMDTKSGQTATISVTVCLPSYCPDDNHPHLIDLGLPSGTKWACCNVDMEKPENQSPSNYGGYYAWGETDAKLNFTENNYLYFNNGDYVSIGDDISGTRYDVARVKWRGSWVMPTVDQINELLGCTTQWTTLNGVKGLRFVGTNGNAIFLPAAGYQSNTLRLDSGIYGYYWSSALNTSEPDCAKALFISYVGIADLWDDFSRYEGRSVRPVSK